MFVVIKKREVWPPAQGGTITSWKVIGAGDTLQSWGNGQFTFEIVSFHGGLEEAQEKARRLHKEHSVVSK